MATGQPNVVYVLPDRGGGVATAVATLLAHRAPDGLGYGVVRTRNRMTIGQRYPKAFPADVDRTVDYTFPGENVHAVCRRLRRALPDGPGVLVASDLLELAMASAHETERAVIHILHGDHEYYYDLAAKHESIVHAFVACSRAMYDTLCRRLPARRESIFHLPFGVAIPAAVRQPASGPLRLLYAGRLEHRQKGVLDLPAIDAALRERQVSVTWTVAGTGSDAAALRQRWGDAAHVRWTGYLPPAALQALLPAHDVFVLPTRFEGFPLALLEAMAAGLVPVVSDIASGVPEVVEPGANGYRPPIGDVAEFARAIAALAADREQLEVLSRAARQTVVERFDARERAAAYQALYARWRDLYRPRPPTARLHYGSRLDQPWIPNLLVRGLRAGRRWLRPATRSQS